MQLSVKSIFIMYMGNVSVWLTQLYVILSFIVEQKLNNETKQKR